MRHLSVAIAALIALLGSSGATTALAHGDALRAAVDSLFAEYDQERGPGCAVAISRDGRLQLSRGYGFASLEHEVPVGPETVFDGCSIAKQFTAAAVALLAKDGRISLDASVRTYLPEMPAYEPPVTVRHLLHHTGGLRDVFTLWELQGRHEKDVYTPEDVLAIVAAQDDLAPEPGARFEYSNTGYLILARVVERVTGQSLGTFTRERFFEPLGMQQTLIYEDRGAVVPHRATGYAPSENGYEVSQYVNFAMGGDGQLFTTVGDLLRWHEYLYGDAADAAQVPSITDLMLTPGKLASGDELAYGLGLFLEDFRGLEEIHHHGVWGGFRAYVTRFPKASVSIAVLCNRADASPWLVGHEIAAMVLEDRMTPPSVPAEGPDTGKHGVDVDTDLLDAYAGRYEVEHLGVVFTFARDGSRLTLEQDTDADLLALQAVDDVTFVSDTAGFMIHFERGADGAVTRATLEASSKSRLRLLYNAGPEHTLRRLLPWSPSAERLAAYAGRYRSAQLETSYTVVVDDAALLLRHRRRGDTRVDPREKDLFGGTFPFTSVMFDRDESDRITGFRVFSGGSQDIRFEKQD
jgi:CubicO group peptidase (beta-lactamase class C family)